MSASIRLGYTARDKVSGFTGIAQNKTDFLTGNIQYSLQPPAKDGVLPDAVSFDVHQLEEVPGPSVPAIIPTAEPIVLGSKVKNIVIGSEGIASRRVTFLNGCVYYIVSGALDPKTQKANEDFFEGNVLETVGVGVAAKIAKKIESTSTVAGKPPGGPSFRVPARG